MFILYAYIVVGGTFSYPLRDWDTLGEFYSSKACINAADELKIPVFKCIAKGN